VEPPYLVDGLKFNFRLYVACTDLDPLRLYIFHDGARRQAARGRTRY
jgi:tubulin polyglutamylase TTLL6/13